MRRLATPRFWLGRGRYFFLYVALALAFVAHLRRFYHPPTGLTSLISLGSRFSSGWVPPLTRTPVYTYADSWGYDGQFYAQLALAGNPLDPSLGKALDSPAYRSRRVLLPVLAFLIGLGRPGWVLEIYALANVVSWLLLAILLARWWFPPTSLENLLRWGGVLFGEGMLASLSRALTDGPAVLLVAAGLRALERNRERIGAGLLACAGLVRETSVLAAAAFLPGRPEERRAWRRRVGLATACVLPALLWIGVLFVHYREAGGGRTFSLPFVSMVAKAREVYGVWWLEGEGPAARRLTWIVVSLAVQAGFIFARPRLREPSWRIGAAFSLLLLVIGPAVWEGFSAAPRVVLPLTLAFNLLVPKGRAALFLLVAGNLTVLSAKDVVTPFVSEQTIFPHRITCAYAEGWHGPETAPERTWRWASGPAALRLRNDDDTPHAVTLSFRLRSVVDRQVRMRRVEEDRRVLVPGGEAGVSVRLGPFPLLPGETVISFFTDEPPWIEPDGARRPLAFAVESFYAEVSPAAGR